MGFRAAQLMSLLALPGESGPLLADAIHGLLLLCIRHQSLEKNLQEVFFPPAFPSLLCVGSRAGHNAELPVSHSLVCCSAGAAARRSH